MTPGTERGVETNESQFKSVLSPKNAHQFLENSGCHSRKGVLQAPGGRNQRGLSMSHIAQESPLSHRVPNILTADVEKPW